MAAPNTVFPPHKSSLGLDANLVMLIAYLGGSLLAFIPIVKYVAFAVPIVIFFIEKSSPYVKFHSAQAIVLQVFNWIVSIISGILVGVFQGVLYSSSDLGAITVASVLVMIFGLITTIVSIVILVFEIICLVKSWKYECYKLPVFGDLAEKLAAKFPIV